MMTHWYVHLRGDMRYIFSIPIKHLIQRHPCVFIVAECAYVLYQAHDHPQVAVTRSVVSLVQQVFVAEAEQEHSAVVDDWPVHAAVADCS